MIAAPEDRGRAQSRIVSLDSSRMRSYSVTSRPLSDGGRKASGLVKGEPMTGIEPAYSAWEVDSPRPASFGDARQGGLSRGKVSTVVRRRVLGSRQLVTSS